jgi:hypothetical protein
LIFVSALECTLRGKCVSGGFRHIFDCAADIAAAVESTLRSLQHLNVINILGAYSLPLELLHVIDVETDPLHDPESTYAAQYHIRRIVGPFNDIQIGYQRIQVIQSGQMRIHNGIGTDHRH